jgi:hypothetical protein
MKCQYERQKGNLAGSFIKTLKLAGAAGSTSGVNIGLTNFLFSH